MQTKRFTNFTDRDFTHLFGGVPYTFKAGESILLEDFKAEHFVKHLVDREMNRMGIVTSNVAERKKLEQQCFTEDDIPEVELPIEEKKAKKNKKVEKEFEDLEVKKRK